MSKTVTFRPLTEKEKITFALKCGESANEQSKMQCPRPIDVAMETTESNNDEPDTVNVQYFCRMHGTHKRNQTAQAVVADNENYGLKPEDDHE